MNSTDGTIKHNAVEVESELYKRYRSLIIKEETLRDCKWSQEHNGYDHSALIAELEHEIPDLRERVWSYVVSITGAPGMEV